MRAARGIVALEKSGERLAVTMQVAARRRVRARVALRGRVEEGVAHEPAQRPDSSPRARRAGSRDVAAIDVAAPIERRLAVDLGEEFALDVRERSREHRVRLARFLEETSSGGRLVSHSITVGRGPMRAMISRKSAQTSPATRVPCVSTRRSPAFRNPRGGSPRSTPGRGRPAMRADRSRGCARLTQMLFTSRRSPHPRGARPRPRTPTRRARRRET
jgi:hypothetical protein